MAQRERVYTVTVDGREFAVTVNGHKEAARVSLNGADYVNADLFAHGQVNQFSLLMGNSSYEGLVEPIDAGYRVWVDGEPFEVAVLEQWMKEFAGGRLAGASGGLPTSMKSPMPGMVVGVAVNPGDEVKKGQPLITLEAMKMRNDLKSPREGVVKAVVAAVGKTVAKGDVLVEFEA
jgi:biotin carboxyl carrier protein